ncbi:MAG TPA: DEAD/DEAH box helicase [Kineosporiaceae bacterium]|jgi:superfamily II DNA/RNA helicase|nr:DEAD/DEAH box helicase [Kineosporiaceae bacterium]
MTQPTMGRGGAATRRRSTTQSRTTSSHPTSRGSSSRTPQRSEPQRSRTTGSSPKRGSAATISALDAAIEQALVREYPEVGTFAELGLPPLLVEALRKRGLTQPFAIQTRALPDALAGRDVLGRAQTGSGKTLAFGLPALTRLAGGGEHLDGVKGVDSAGHRVQRTSKAPRALVLVPTRELALQVTGNLAPLAAPLGLNVHSVVGGAPYGRQIDALTRGVDILVATPGRLVDLIERGACRLDLVEITVLDEADYMADLGFLPVVTRLLEMTPAGGQRLLFSATLDRGVAGLVDRFLDNPVVHAVAPTTQAVASMTHQVFMVGRDDKIGIAAEVAARPARTLFFVRTKHGADRLAKQLGRAGVDAAAIHGNLAQGARQRVLAAFAEGRTRVLVATDVAARGIHVDDVSLVVHYDPPADHKDYLHRSGRTARAGNDGAVVALVHSDQLSAVRRLHADANVDATIENVSPGHPAVRAVAESGEPIVVRAPAETVRASSGSGRGPNRNGGADSYGRPGRRPGRPRGRRDGQTGA